MPEHERVQRRADGGGTFYRMAQTAVLKATGAESLSERTPQLANAERWNAVAEHYAGDRLPRSVREQRAAIAELRGKRAEAEQLRAEATRVPLESARDLYFLGSLLSHKGHHRDALPYLRRSTHLDPQNFSAWFVRGTVHLELDQDDSAVTCFSACLALRNDFAPAWLNRGLALSRLRAFDQACEDYDRAISLNQDFVEAYLQRSIARTAGNDLKAEDRSHTRLPPES